MNVFVLNYDGKPLMPTKRGGRVRKLLDSGEAIVVKRMPFTIQLVKEKKRYTQMVSLGVKSGSRNMELSATTEKEELFFAEGQLRTDIVNLLSSRKEYRQKRRHRLRYRPSRFNNRIKSKKPGWIAPSIRNKIQFHLKMVDLVHQILPINFIHVEIGSFDIQKLKDPNIDTEERKNGPQKGFSNTREYVLFRDSHTCQCCKGKSGDKILQVHHIESRKTGGNAPSNLITLCKTCHDKYHKGHLKIKIDKGKSFKIESIMNIMKTYLLKEITYLYRKETPLPTFGYQTKQERFRLNLSRSEYSDAQIISWNCDSLPIDYKFVFKQIRRHNRRIFKAKFIKGGILMRSQASYSLFGFRLHDVVKYNNSRYLINSRRSNGQFILRSIEDNSIVYRSFRKIKFQYISNRLIMYHKQRKKEVIENGCSN